MAAVAEEWVRVEIAVGASQDIEQILSCYTDDCIYENVPLGKICNGKDEIREFFKIVFTGFPDFKVNLKS